VAALLLLLEAPLPRVAGELFNVCDDTPVCERDFYAALAARFARPLPPGAPATQERKRPATHKRVSNAKLRALGWQPLYPSFADALADIT